VSKLIGFLRLTRPANIVTAIADILAGAAIAGVAGAQLELSSILLLVLATVGLYGGGVVFNDVFDADLDKVERPERPIPSGLIPKNEGALLGTLLLIMGIVSASVHSFYPSGIIALAIAIAALVYDKWGKHHSFLGPLNMGLCRGLNLLLGMSVVAGISFPFAYLAIVPVIYIAAITMISRGEVHGGKSGTMVTAAFLYIFVIASIIYVSFINNQVGYTLIFILAFAAFIFPPLVRAMNDPIGKNIGKAVKAGVLALIIMNASWAAACGFLNFAVTILLLLPVSLLLGRLFAVT
jgi:4-hydroxybenzoate polyprenyltransferase